MRNLTPEHRAALRIRGATNGAMSRGAGRTASKDYVQCCVCCYSVGLGVKKIGKVTNINHAMVRKILIKQGVYKGNTGRKPYPWKDGKACSVRHEDLFAAYGYDKELRVLRQTDDCKHWVSHSASVYHFHGAKMRARAREQWRTMKNDPVFRARKRANQIDWRRRASQCSIYRMVQAIRSRTSTAIRRANNREDRDERTIELLGCSYSFLRKWIKYQFTKGLSFDNYGKWQVDHIVPIASFDLRSEVQRRICFHYTNLRPLWAKENNEKSGNIVDCQPELVMSL